MSIVQSVELWCNEANHDKVYQLQIVETSVKNKYDVTFQYGRRGSTLKAGTKVTGVPLMVAEAEYEKILKEKLGKGYKVMGGRSVPAGIPSGSVPINVSATKVVKPVLFLPQLLNSIDENAARGFIGHDDFVAQEKKDGKHVTLHRKGGEVKVTNKKGQAIDFPLTFLEGLPDEVDDVVIDGEAIGDTFWAFDLLEIYGESLRNQGFLDRFGQLEAMFPDLHIVPVAVGIPAKQKLFDDLMKAGREGIVFKRLNAPYSPGRPSTGGDMFKCKFYAEASVRVAAKNAKRSVAMEVLNGSGIWLGVGNVTIPPNKTMPSVGDVIEVRYLYAYHGGSLFQPIFKEIRDDVDLGDCVIGQLKYKSEED